MKKIYYLLVILLLLNLHSKANNASAGELTYEWISNNTYRFTFKFYRDCSGLSAPNTISMCYINTCTQMYYSDTLTKPILLPDGKPNGTTIYSNVCLPTTCVDINSNIPGFEEWCYKGNITLSDTCSQWIFYVGESMRNTQYNINNGKQFLYATLNNALTPTNSSADFAFKSVFYTSLNQLFIYNNGPYDVDGDSLSFTFTQPLSSGNSISIQCDSIYPPVIISGNSNFSAYHAITNPIPCDSNYLLQIDSFIGIIRGKSNVKGKNIVTVEISEWRQNIKIATLIRDLQLIISDSIFYGTLSLQSSILNDTGNFYIFNYVQGGVPPLLFSLNNGPFQTSDIFYNISPGSYTVTAKDFFGCTSTCWVYYNPTKMNKENSIETIKIYPNPAKNEITIIANNNAQFNDASICIINIYGQIVLKQKQITLKNNLVVNVENLLSGNYLLLFEDRKKTRKKVLRFTKTDT
jgi:Secretion system C-terminal sorting domain